MGRVVMNGPPDCPDGDWCPACLMQAKQRQWEGYQDRIKAGFAADGQQTTYVAWPNVLNQEMRPGSYRAVCGDFPHLGIIDGLCWDHVAGINPSQSPSHLIQGLAVPPGLRKGQG